MSATHENASRTRRNAESNATPPTNGADKPAELGNVTIEIAGLEVTLPVKFAPGHVLTDNQAKVLDAAYQRQFTNNQNASAKSRAEAYGKATTDAERAAKAPLTAAQIAALYSDYEPAVGGTPRQSTMDRLRHEAAWRMWVALEKSHNDAVAAGGAPIIAKAGAKAVSVKFRAVKSEDGKTVVTTAEDQKAAFTGKLLETPVYAASIQEHLDAIMAERGKDKPAASDTVVTSGVDLL